MESTVVCLTKEQLQITEHTLVCKGRSGELVPELEPSVPQVICRCCQQPGKKLKIASLCDAANRWNRACPAIDFPTAFPSGPFKGIYVVRGSDPGLPTNSTN